MTLFFGLEGREGCKMDAITFYMVLTVVTFKIEFNSFFKIYKQSKLQEQTVGLNIKEICSFIESFETLPG